MKAILLNLDDLIIDTTSKIAVERGVTNTKLLRDLVYTFVWNEMKGQPIELRQAPTYPRAMANPQRLRVFNQRIVSVDEHGLLIEGEII